MKCSNIILGGLVALAATAVAMPTQEETKRVEPLVLDLMKADQVALKNGRKTRAEVAESARALADKADSEPAKLLLLKGAFNLYVRAGEFDKAIETLQALQAIIPDIPPAHMVNVIETSLRGVSRKNGKRLYQFLDETKMRMRYVGTVKKMENLLKAHPDDCQLRVKLAECYAYLGNWEKALENFVAAEGKAGTVAKSELDDDADEKAADFWWAYPTGKPNELVKAFRAHAAELYEGAIASGKMSGLAKVQAERRIAELKDRGEQANVEMPAAVAKGGLYCVIDLSAGPSARHYPVKYVKAAPTNGWGDEYKTTKLVLRRIDAGKYPILSSRNKVLFTRPFYIGIFELTQKQVTLIAGDIGKNFVFEGDMRPADCLNYEDLRGKDQEFDYPKVKDVSPNSIIGKLRAKTGIRQIDLPTSFQFECAWNAGGNGNVRDANLSGRHFANQGDGKGGFTSKHTTVGSYQPNEWGIYDLHGNVWEMCVDRGGVQNVLRDPEGPTEGINRQLRGGCWNSSEKFIFSTFNPQVADDHPNGKGGCRIAITCVKNK